MQKIGDGSTIYLFAYGGCMNPPAQTNLLTGADLRKWFAENKNGKKYMEMLGS